MKKLLVLIFVLLSVYVYGESKEILNGYQKFKSEFFELQWKVVGNTMDIVVSAKCTGWVAIGFDPTRMMKNANLVIAYVKDGKVYIEDDFGKSAISHTADTRLGGTDDILEYSGEEIDGVTTIKFKIKLNSGDKFDSNLGEGKHKVILACSNKDNFKSYHKHKAKTTINISLPKKQRQSNKTLDKSSTNLTNI